MLTYVALEEFRPFLSSINTFSTYMETRTEDSLLIKSQDDIEYFVLIIGDNAENN
jgi:hypothetical protein